MDKTSKGLYNSKTNFTDLAVLNNSLFFINRMITFKLIVAPHHLITYVTTELLTRGREAWSPNRSEAEPAEIPTVSFGVQFPVGTVDFHGFPASEL